MTMRRSIRVVFLRLKAKFVKPTCDYCTLSCEPNWGPLCDVCDNLSTHVLVPVIPYGEGDECSCAQCKPERRVSPGKLSLFFSVFLLALGIFSTSTTSARSYLDHEQRAQAHILIDHDARRCVATLSQGKSIFCCLARERRRIVWTIIADKHDATFSIALSLLDEGLRKTYWERVSKFAGCRI